MAKRAPKQAPKATPKQEATRPEPMSLAVPAVASTPAVGTAPRCPNCPGTQCVPQSRKTLFTWFVCPHNCGYRQKVPRADLKQRLERMDASHPAVQRP